MQMQTNYTVFVECTVTDPGERRRRLATVYQCILQVNRDIPEQALVASEDDAHERSERCSITAGVLVPG